MLYRAGTDIAHYAICHAVVYKIHQPCRKGGNGSENEYFRKINPHCVKIHLALVRDIVYRIAEEHRNIELERHGKCGKDYPRKKEYAVFRDKPHQLAEGAFTAAEG